MDPSSLPVPDLAEHGGIKDGARQSLDRRLYVQLLAFGNVADAAPLVQATARLPMSAVLYADANDPRGIGLLVMAEDPAVLTGPLRDALAREPFAGLAQKPALTMLGRTYALGHEPDLADALLARPRRAVLDPEWPWAVWYPLRRAGAFARQPEDDQRAMLREHAVIGMAYGRAGLARDVRLACFGLDQHDNDFVVGLTGARLDTLSKVVEAMRQTRQTSEFIERLGPFFVGHVLVQHDAG